MYPEIGRILITESQLKKRIEELGTQISNDYIGIDFAIICVLKGAFMFLSDLLRAIEGNPSVDFIHVSSYGDSNRSSGEVKVIQDLVNPIRGISVLIVDDVVDTGLTLHYLKEFLSHKGPADIKICALLNKIKKRNFDVKIDYFGFEIPDEYVVGYGMDYKGRFRGLRYIASFSPGKLD